MRVHGWLMLGVLVATAASAAAPPVAAQQVRVRSTMPDTAALRSVTSGDAAEVLRVVNELRAREARILRELELARRDDPDSVHDLEMQLARLSRDAFTVMSLIESRCLDQRANTPAGYLGLNITSEVEVRDGKVTRERSVVTSLEPGSPAEQSGIQAGDRLLSLGGRDARARVPELGGILEPGRRVVVRVERDGVERDFSMTVAPRPRRFDAGCPQFERAMQPLRMGGLARVWVQDSTDASGNRRVYVMSPAMAPTPPTPAAPRTSPTPPAPPAPAARPAVGVSAVAPAPGVAPTPPTPPAAPSVFVFGSTPGGTSYSFFAGAQFRQLDDDWRAVLGLRPGTEGVLVNEVAPGSAAAQSGLRAGDVVTMVGNTQATSPLVVSRILGLTEGSQATLRVLRGREMRTVTLRWSGGGGR